MTLDLLALRNDHAREDHYYIQRGGQIVVGGENVPPRCYSDDHGSDEGSPEWPCVVIQLLDLIDEERRNRGHDANRPGVTVNADGDLAGHD